MRRKAVGTLRFFIRRRLSGTAKPVLNHGSIVSSIDHVENILVPSKSTEIMHSQKPNIDVPIVVSSPSHQLEDAYRYDDVEDLVSQLRSRARPLRAGMNDDVTEATSLPPRSTNADQDFLLEFVEKYANQTSYSSLLDAEPMINNGEVNEPNIDSTLSDDSTVTNSLQELNIL